jgi:RNA recognition motif-containing protein
MNLFVSNISRTIKADELKQLFESVGDVKSVKIISDKYTGESKGFGFVEMTNDNQGLLAIQQLTDTELRGRRLTVTKAKPRISGY